MDQDNFLKNISKCTSHCMEHSVINFEKKCHVFTALNSKIVFDMLYNHEI